MATKKTPATRTPKSRSEVAEDFDDVRKKVRTAEPVSVKEREQQTHQKDAVRNAVAELSPEAIANKITNLNLAVSRSLASVNEQLAAQLLELQQVREATQTYQEELQRLHDVDKVLTSLDVLVAQHDERLKSDEQERTMIRARWAEESKARDQAAREAAEDMAKTRKRDEADYQYATAQKRKIEEDTAKETLRVTEATRRDTEEKFNKSMASREAELVAREQELSGLRAQVTEFPAILKAAEGKATGMVEARLNKDHAHAVEMLRKDQENTAKLADITIASLKGTIDRQTAEILSLGTRLSESEKNVRTIAEKALESASGRGTLAAMTEFSRTDGQQNGGTRKGS